MVLLHMKRASFVTSILLTTFGLSGTALADMPAPTVKYFVSSQYDLDGDGENDNISVSLSSATSNRISARVEISVNGVLFTQDARFGMPKVEIVDVDKKDGRRELVLSEEGESAWKSGFYSFDGEKIYKSGEVYGRPGRAKDEPGAGDYFLLRGDGHINSAQPSRLLQGWWVLRESEIIALGNGYRLETQTGGIYNASAPYTVTVIKPFRVYQSMSDTAQTRMLNPGERITLNASDEDRWVRFVDKNGKAAYIRMQEGDGFRAAIKGYGDANDYLSGLQERLR